MIIVTTFFPNTFIIRFIINVMKKQLLLPLLCLSPLLMANSPAPMPSDEPYDDINVNCTYLGEDGDFFRYQIDLENKGDKYTGIKTPNGLAVDGHYFYIRNIEGQLFNNELVSPHTSKSYIVTTDTKYTIDDEMKWYSWTYSFIDEEVTFNNPTFKKVSNLTYQLKTDDTQFGDYYYNVVVEIDYEGINYAFSIDDHYSKDLTFHTTEDIDLNKINITKITAFRSSYTRYKGLRINLESFFKYAFWFLVGFILFHAIVATAVVVPIVVVRKKRRENYAKSHEINNKE